VAITIRGGTVVNAFGRCRADVRLESGRVVAIGADVAQPGDEVLDATGCYVMPGGIDPHTHIEMPAGDLGYNADDWYSGTAAAVAGGTTCVLDMITQEPGGTLMAALSDWRRRAQAGAVCNYGFHMGIIDPRPEVLDEMAQVAASGAPSFKLYLAYRGRLMVDDGAAFRIMRAAGRLGALMLVHAENGDVIDVLVGEARAAGRLDAGMHGATRPAAAEGEATHRAIQLARMAEAPVYIVHVSCREALAAVRSARREGQAVWAEACCHHLLLTEQEYERPGFAAAPYVISPPLRGTADVAALWGGLDDGTLDLVATDHCPWNLRGQKERGRHDFAEIPSGAPGVEERLALLWTHGVEAGRWSVEQFVARTSANAARIFGLATKGAVLPGYDADLVVWDPANRRNLSVATQHSRADHSIYEGMAVAGQARFTLVQGRVAAQEAQPVCEAGWGQLARRDAVGIAAERSRNTAGMQ
jgi:dihydropyrimidinase